MKSSGFRKIQRGFMLVVSLLLGAGASQAADFSSWSAGAQIQFTGYAKTETLTNFPALVMLGTNITGFSYSQFLSGTNADLRFTDSTLTNELNYEVDTWNTNGISSVWVQVPRLTSNTVIGAYWGKAATNAPAYTTNGAVWGSNYRGVWHLKQPSGSAYDSTSNQLTGTINGGVTQNAAGEIGNALTFNGSSGYVQIGAVPALDLQAVDKYTISAWVYATTANTGCGVISEDYNWVGGGNSRIQYELGMGIGSGGFQLSSGFYDGTWRTAMETSTFPLGQWVHIVGTWDGATMRTLRNGVVVASGTPGGSIPALEQAVYIGRRHDNTTSPYFAGSIDEVRIAAVASSTNWVWAEWMNVASNSLFQAYTMNTPAIINLPPTNFAGGYANLNGSLLSTGIAPTTVYVAYGTTDGSTNASNWGTFVNLSGTGMASTGGYTTNVAVPGGGTLFYRYAASNSFGLVWATPVQSVNDGALMLSVPNALAQSWLGKTANFQIIRPTSLTNGPLTVNYVFSGTASNGVDYAALPLQATIPDGATIATITITGLVQPVQPLKTVILTLAAGGYSIGSPNVATAVVQQANIYYVTPAPAGNDSTGVTNAPIHPYASITNVLSKAGAGDLIEVTAGVYTQNVVFAVGQSSIIIRGGYDPTTWNWAPASNTSTIRGSNGAPVSLSAGAMSDTLSYLTLTGGGASYPGIQVNGAITNITVESSIIFSNQYGFLCGTAYLTNMVLKNTLVARNSVDGIRVCADSGYCYLFNCTVVSNGANGVNLYNSGGQSQNGGIVPVAMNCIFSDNNGLGLTKANASSGSSIQNCLFFNNTGGPATGRMVTDLGGNKCGRSPQYINAAMLNYQASNSSPAVAAGANLSALGINNDVLGVSRPGANGWDIGAYQGSGTGEAALSSVVYVSTNGNNSTGNGTTNGPWATIGYALGNIAQSGTVLVAGGNFKENVVFGPGHRYMTVKGGYDPTTWNWNPATNHTVINGNSASPIQLDSCADTTTVSFVTITGGGGNAGVAFNANVYGVLLEGCTIISNYYGVAGIRARGLTVKNSIVTKSTSDGFNFTSGINEGGGQCYLYNCTVATNGGAGFLASEGNGWAVLSPTAKNTLFTDNKTYGFSVTGGAAPSMGNCFFFNNASGPTFGTISDFGGNKSGLNPLYTNIASNDFTIATNSPAAAAGTNLTAVGVTNDIMGVVRPGPFGYDMGAYQVNGAGAPVLTNLCYVSVGGSNAVGYGVSNKPYASISFALANTATGGLVRIASGVYTDNVQFAANNKNITLRGGYDPSTWSWNPSVNHTTINGNGGSAVQFAAAADSNTLSCLTLMGGTNVAAAGVQVSGSINGLVVDGCTIVSNLYGLVANDVVLNGTIKNTVIARNTSYGVCCGTSMNGSGGLLYLYNCTLANNGNSSFYSLSVNWAWGSVSPVAKNTLFTDNGGYGLEHRGEISGAGSMQDCLFYNNALGPTATSWQNTPLVDLGGNKSGRDPKYVNATALNYAVAANSPAAAAGTNLTAVGVTNDIVNAARPGSAVWDMGAYQGSGLGEGALPLTTYVRSTGSDSTGNGSSSSPWATAGYALGYTAPSGTVCVAGGTYNDNVRFGPDKKWVTVQGGYNPDTWAWEPTAQTTVINGNGNAPVLITSGANSNTVAYLTLVGGTNSAGVSCNGTAISLLVDGCTVTGNLYGVNCGVFLQQPTLRNTLLARNNAHGVYFNQTSGGYAGQCWLYNCTVVSNNGSGYLGDFATNQWDVVPIAKNCLFTDNAGYGVSKGGMSAGGSIQNCLFYNNASGATYSSIYGATLSDLGNNTSNAVPLYVNAAVGNYQLQRLSPAVDTGTNLTALGVTLDLLGVHRPLGAGFDRGAYERSSFPAGSVIIVE